MMFAHSQNEVQKAAQMLFWYFQQLFGTESALVNLFLKHLKNISGH